MFNTMTLTKIAAGLFGAWLVLLLGKFVGDEVYTAETHGEQGYVIEVASADDAAEEEEGPDFETVLASADVDAGERVFRKCTACHQLEPGANAVGPHLYDVVGRDVGAVDGYGAYSGALSEAADVWTAANLNGFLENPSNYAPGTSMGFAGLNKVEDRANVIAYLDTIGD